MAPTMAAQSDAEERRERVEQIVSGFADAAAAVQEARGTEEIFRIARARLQRLGLWSVFAEIRGGSYVYLYADGPLEPLADELRRRYPDAIPLAAGGMQSAICRSPQGVLIEEFPPMAAQTLGRPRSEVAMASDSSAVGAAIHVNGELAYTMTAVGAGLDRAAAGAFSLFARHIGAAIETERRLAQLADNNRELSCVNHVALSSAALGSGRALQSAVEWLALSVRVEAVALLRCERDELVLTAHTGLPEEWVASATRVRINAGLPWSLAAQGSEPRSFSLRPGDDSVAIPLRVGKELLGLLIASRRGAPLSSAEQRLLGTVGAQLAVSLQNTLLFEQTERRVGELSLLLELGQAVAGSFDLPQILHAGARVVTRALRCSGAYVFMPNERGDLLEVAACEDPLGPTATLASVPLDRPSLTARAFVTGEAHTSSASRTDPRIDPELNALFGCRATLAVPLRSHERTLGVLMLFERASERLFDEQDIRLAGHAAQLLAASAENAGLYADQSRRAAEMTQLYEELERAQADRVARERLAALGELSASIAHEVRNPLGVIFNALGSLRRHLKSEGNVGLLLGIIGEEAERLNHMVAELLDYSRPLQPALEPVPLRPLVEDALQSVRAHVESQEPRAANPPAIRVELRIPPELTLRADLRLLRQALVNLLLNAFQAMPKGGTLDVIAERAADSRAEAIVRIRDSGVGVPAAVRPRIFAPFFTTKATGTGLGLAVVKRIIEGHGGRIELRDEHEGVGAEFQLHLPVEE